MQDPVAPSIPIVPSMGSKSIHIYIYCVYVHIYIYILHVYIYIWICMNQTCCGLLGAPHVAWSASVNLEQNGFP